MQWHMLFIVLALCSLVGMGIWGYAYRLGLRHGRSTNVPFRLIDELLDHKIHCLGEEPAVARVELETSLGIEAWESQSMVQHALRTREQDETAPGLPPTPQSVVLSK
jgi:hypothetical protein